MANTICAREHVKISLRDTIFKADAVFSKDTFTNKVEFFSTKFASQARFRYCKFDSPTYFSYSTFDTFVSFNSAVFQSDASYFGTSFKELTSFENVQFHKGADFSLTTFDTNVSFAIAHFHNNADFSYATFLSAVNFNATKFSNKLKLANITVGQNAKIKFKYCTLPDTIDLSYNPNFNSSESTVLDLSLSDFSDDIDSNVYSTWTKIKQLFTWYLFPAKCVSNNKIKNIHWINLYNTDISKIKIDYIHFRLYFESEREDLLTDERGSPIGYLKIEDVSLSKDAKLAVYEQLLKNFKDRGLLESYKYLDIEYQHFKNHDMFFDVEEWWWGYGYEKKRIFIHAILFFLLFSLLNFFKIHDLNGETTSGYYLGFIPNELYSENEKISLKILLQRSWASLVYTFIVFFQPTLKLDNVRPKNVGAMIWVLFIYSIGLFCLGYIANFIFQK